MRGLDELSKRPATDVSMSMKPVTASGGVVDGRPAAERRRRPAQLVEEHIDEEQAHQNSGCDPANRE